MTGDLNVAWIHGAANCAVSTDPPIQVHRFDLDTYILRQSMCSDRGTVAFPGPSYEAPFMYLLIGDSRALLLDSGASRQASRCPVASIVRDILDRRAAERGIAPLPLVVAHTHSHGDHVAGDGQFAGRPDTTVVPLGVPGVTAFFGFTDWPRRRTTFDLGGRVLDVIPSPGHEASHLVFYDRHARLLLTGDTLYPGLLVVSVWADYVRSVARLQAFARTHQIDHVLGSHIEMTRHPGRWFGRGVYFHPEEHVLQLGTAQLADLHAALQAIGPTPRIDRHDDFIIFPAQSPFDPPLAPP